MGILEMKKGRQSLVRKCESTFKQYKTYRDGDEEYVEGMVQLPWDFEEVREKLGVEMKNRLRLPIMCCHLTYTVICRFGKSMPTAAWCLEIEGTPVGNEMKAIQQKWFASFDEFIDHKDEIRFL